LKISKKKELNKMTTMTVTDALAELTLLEKRIDSARSQLDENTLIAVVEVGKVPTGYRSRDEHATQARAALQRVDALIARRRAIKRAIVLSNASVMVAVAGQEMTVAEAIEMKNFITYSQSVVDTMQDAHAQTRKDYEAARTKVKERLDKLAMEVLGKNASAEKYQSLADSFLEREGVELLDPTNLAEQIENRQAFVEQFESTVDRVLSISNARTNIEVPD
jgi:flagellar biosynthesis chaperone FliJ